MTNDHLSQYNSLVSRRAIINYQMATCIPPNGTITVSELAKACGMHPDNVAIILAHGTTHRLFLLNENGELAHSAATMALTIVPGLATCADMILNTQWKIAPELR